MAAKVTRTAATRSRGLRFGADVRRVAGALDILSAVRTADADRGYDVVVAGDGSIPAAQLAVLGVRPGEHLRVVVAGPAAEKPGFRDSLKGLPEPTWDDFERASELARSDLEIP